MLYNVEWFILRALGSAASRCLMIDYAYGGAEMCLTRAVSVNSTEVGDWICGSPQRKVYIADGDTAKDSNISVRYLSRYMRMSNCKIG